MASTAATRTAAGAARVVKPIFSRDLDEAKRRVRELYRAFYREVPNTGMYVCWGFNGAGKTVERQGRLCPNTAAEISFKQTATKLVGWRV